MRIDIKKLLLLFIAAAITNASFAQKGGGGAFPSNDINALNNLNALSEHTGIKPFKQTAPGDTVYMAHIALTDTITLYYAGAHNGFVHGMNSYGDKGFAERYDFSGEDSSVRVIGAIARFGGTVVTNSTKSVVFSVWTPAEKSASATRPTLYNSGLPGIPITSKTFSFTELGVAADDTSMDQEKVLFFHAPTAPLTSSFFIGYTVNYTWGNGMTDTIGLYSNKDGERTAPSFTVASYGDTIINNVSVTRFADGTWHDNAIDNFEIRANLYVFPIVIVGPGVLETKGLSRGNLTFYGASPNPAANNTNLKLNLTNSTDVSIRIMDMTGHTIRSVNGGRLSAGTHTLAVETTDLSTGDYIFFINTSDGSGLATKVSIVK